MKSFVINLKRRPERLEQFKRRCPLQDTEVVYGFDAKNYHQESKKEQKLFNGKFQSLAKYQPGVRGCFISHLRIWKRMIDQNIPYATVFEDDALFNSKFTEIYNSLHLQDINLLYIGGRFQDNFTMPSDKITKINETIGIHNYTTWEPRFHDRTTHGYIISYQLAKFFIELVNIQETFEAVDYFMVFSLKNNKIPVYSTIPLICWSPIQGDSDIR